MKMKINGREKRKKVRKSKINKYQNHIDKINKFFRFPDWE